MILPESILIQTINDNSGKFVVRLVNDAATKKIIKIDNHWGQPIDDCKLEYNFKMINNHKNASISFDEEQQDEETVP